jgi:hypothetical protein
VALLLLVAAGVTVGAVAAAVAVIELEAAGVALPVGVAAGVAAGLGLMRPISENKHAPLVTCMVAVHSVPLMSSLK